MLKASDIMLKNPVAVTPETTVEELGRMFIDSGLTGAPVVDSLGELIGVVTEHDLISRDRPLHIPTLMRLFDAYIPLEGSKAFEDEIRRISAKSAGDICTREPITATPDTTIEEIATLMTDKRVHHIPVVDGQKLVGMIGQHDVLRGISGDNQ